VPATERDFSYSRACDQIFSGSCIVKFRMNLPKRKNSEPMHAVFPFLPFRYAK
jgi:hypothetical protein